MVMRVAREIVTQYSGTFKYSGIFNRAPEDIDSDPDNIRIVLVEDDGSQRELFRGSEFSEKKLAEEFKRRDRTSKLEQRI